MTRNRGSYQQALPIIRADQLGYPYPPMPVGGPRQILGSMSVDENITPAIPEWVPKRLWLRWSELWHSRVKQYKRPGSKELLPWDTTHNVLGDYNGYEEYYVKGCFGYDEQGKEIMYRPVLPQIHYWRGQGLHILVPEWTALVLPAPIPTLFNFYSSTSRLLEDELDDIKLGNCGAPAVSRNSDRDIIAAAEDDLAAVFATDIFEDFPASDRSRNLEKTFESMRLAECDQLHVSNTNVNLLGKSASTAKGHKAKVTLMNLPGEVRNLIYKYLFEESVEYEIVWCTTKKDLTHYVHKIPLAIKGFKTGWRHQSRDDDSLDVHFKRPVLDRSRTTARRHQARVIYGEYNHEDRVEELQAAGPAAFLLTCRQAYKETVCLFYSQQTFCFCSRSLLRYFMGKLSPHTLASIKRLYVAHDAQAWPLRSTDAMLVKKEHNLWIQDLKKMVAACTDLEELTMLLQIRDPHVNNTDRAEWAMALRRGLADLKHLDKFHYLDLTIRLADDTSNVTWATTHGTRLQADRARDLETLVCLVKSKIFATV